MNKRDDARTVRTKTLIKKAFAELIEEKEIEQITVKELSERAGIHRGTFYIHYKDVYDVIEQTKYEMVESLDETFKNINDKLDSPIPLLNNLYELAKRDFWVYKAIINAKWSGQYTKSVKQLITDKYFQLNASSTNPKDKYLLSFIVSGAIGMFQDWVLSGEPFPMEEIHDVLTKYVTDVLKAE